LYQTELQLCVYAQVLKKYTKSHDFKLFGNRYLNSLYITSVLSQVGQARITGETSHFTSVKIGYFVVSPVVSSNQPYFPISRYTQRVSSMFVDFFATKVTSDTITQISFVKILPGSIMISKSFISSVKYLFI
jgi:hypothetical protein